MGRPIDQDQLREQLEHALLRLTKRTHDTACVLLEDRATQKFIQFGRGPELILDLPLNSLAEPELERARCEFRKLGIKHSRNLEAGDVNQEPVRREFETLECNFGSDAATAAAAAIEVFSKTYQLDRVEYLLHEN